MGEKPHLPMDGVVVPYKFCIEEQEDYIKVEVSGERGSGNAEEDAVRVWSRVAEVCAAKKIDRVLGIYKVTGRLPATAAHAIAFDPARFGWSRRFKLAIANLNEESRQDSLFLEDVAVSSGYDVRIFDSEEEAETWLLAQRPSR
ncbi:MAG: hypothetical protein IIB77_08130 [Proteobacteria bacterium]|nr:hypothetical protein [Pseudomonadota bacterium]